MAQINNILTEIKQHILGCFAFLDCGFENVRQLLNAVKGNDPQGFREYEHVLFDDRLGNYFWIEKTSDVSITRKNNGILGTCKGAYHEARQRFSLFCMVNGTKEEQLFECLAGCLANYGCTLTITGGEYDSIAVVQKELGNIEGINEILGNLANYSIVRLDFNLIYDILPTNYDLQGCECEPCLSCNDNLPTVIVPPPCPIAITGLEFDGTQLDIKYTATGADDVGLMLTYQGNDLILDCNPNTGIYTEIPNATFIAAAGVTATLGASNDSCATNCSEASFVTLTDNKIVPRKGGIVQILPPNTIPACGGTIGYVYLYSSGVAAATINPLTGVVGMPAQNISTQGNFYYYVTCNGLVICTVRLILTNS